MNEARLKGETVRHEMVNKSVIKKALHGFSLIVVGLVLSACSSQYRTADTGRDPSDIMQMVSSLQGQLLGSAAASGSDLSDFFALANDTRSLIYFTEGPNPNLGPVHSVFSVPDLHFLGPEFQGMNSTILDSVEIYFVTLPPSTGQAQCALLISIVPQGGTQSLVKAYSCAAIGTDGGGFLAILSENGQDVMTLRSYDVDENNEFKGAIQLRIGTFDIQGTEQPNGQISVLVGYGQ